MSWKQASEASSRAEDHRRRWIGGLIPIVGIAAAIVIAVVLGTPGPIHDNRTDRSDNTANRGQAC